LVLRKISQTYDARFAALLAYYIGACRLWSHAILTASFLRLFWKPNIFFLPAGADTRMMQGMHHSPDIKSVYMRLEFVEFHRRCSYIVVIW